MDAVAKTSLLTAAMRAHESERTDEEGRLFSDPYAKLLAGVEGQALLEKALKESGDQPAIAVRTYYMDQKISEALTQGVRQIVMIAAGMDTRAFRLQNLEGACVFELDRSEVLDYKNSKLNSEKLFCKRISVPVDLTIDWTQSLLKSGYDKTQKTLWLVEGLLMYLHESEVITLFTRLNGLAHPYDIMLFDVLSRTLLEAPHMQKQLQFLREIGAPWNFGINDPEKFMNQFNWSVEATQPGDFVPSRWPFPVAPLHIPNVPRSYFVRAVKK